MDLGQLISFVQVACCACATAGVLILLVKMLFPSGLDSAAINAETGLVPKGSLGLPFIGETIQFTSSDPVAFCKPRMERYGKVFKTNLIGTPTIIVTCPEVAKYVLTDRLQQFIFTYPSYVEQLLGDADLGFSPETRLSVRDSLHRACISFFSPENLRLRLAEIESMAFETLLSWAGAETVESVAEESIKRAQHFIAIMQVKASVKLLRLITQTLTMKMGVRLILGLERNDPLVSKLHGYYCIYTQGLRCLPIRLPGTDYSKALKAKQRLRKELQSLTVERAISRMASTPEADHAPRSLLDVILNDMNVQKEVNSTQEMDVVAGLVLLTIFGSRDTVACTITWAMKHLWESPDVLKAVTKENDEIRRRKGQGEPLTWTDYKEAKYTVQVIREVIRISSVSSGVTRKALEDVRCLGHNIPKGWNVMIIMPAIHKNSEYYSDPMKFDPSRFEKPLKPNTFLPFGSGRHACVGQELAKLQLFVFLHLLTTQFSYEVTGDDSGIQHYPFPLPNDGLKVKIRSRLPRD